MDNIALNYYLTLIEGGVKDAEARIQAQTLTLVLDGLATKGELKYEIHWLEVGLNGEIGGIKTRLNVLIALNVSTLAFMLAMILNSVKHWW